VKPFLRATDRGQLAPVGWVSEPAGQWAGKEVDVVYDPRRHDVAFLRGEPGNNIRDGFRDTGYRRVAVDGTNEMWVRDRLAATIDALDRVARPVERQRSADLGGRSL
jgi:hypothetical protein